MGGRQRGKGKRETGKGGGGGVRGKDRGGERNALMNC